MSQLRLLGDRVLVETIAVQATASGIIIPETGQGRPEQALVKAVGPGRREEGELVPVDVQVGDVVYFVRHSGVPIDNSGEEQLVLREQDILAVVDVG